MGSGPSAPETRVLRAMALPPLPADHPEYVALLNDLTCQLRDVFCARSANAFVVPGASRSGIEAVLNSLVEPGEFDVNELVGRRGHHAIRLHAHAPGADRAQVQPYRCRAGASIE